MRNIPAIIKKRPALKLAALAIAGLLIGHYFDVSPVVLLFILITLTIAATILLCVKNSLTNCFLIVTFIVAGFLSYEFSTRVFPSHHITYFVDSSEKVTITGTVKGFPVQKSDRVEIELETREILQGSVSHATQGKILVRIWQVDFFPGYGEKLQIYGRLNEPRGERNPGDFDYKKFLDAD
jgi:competence protein ComEC